MDIKRKAYLEACQVSRKFEDGAAFVAALQDVSFQIMQGEFVCIIGRSGCGKSTLLRILAGLDHDYAGTVRVSGEIVTRPSRRIGVVFQEPRLFPWLTVRQNVAFALADIPSETREKIVRDHLDMVGLLSFAEAMPRQLSGGMAQRVSIARALVNRPEVMLMDEPFGALDYITKQGMQEELLRIKEQEGMTIIFVTHDIDEAVYLSDRIIIMDSHPGRIKAEVQCSIAKPRDRNGEDFMQLRGKVFAYFQDMQADYGE